MPAIRARIRNWLPDAVLDFYVALRVHKAEHGRYPNLLQPRTYNERIARRKALDRRALLTVFADKYESRNYVAERVGSEVLTKLYCVTPDPADIPFDELPVQFVVKPNHGSGWIRIIADATALDRAELINQCQSWLRSSYYERHREWPYKNVVPRILVEEFIHDGGGCPAADFKFYVFGGRVELIQVDTARFVRHQRAFFDRNWADAGVTMMYPPIDGGVPRPKHFSDMMTIAEELGREIDFVRVDLYDTENKVYFGELTTTPVNGRGRFEPAHFDEYLGKVWQQSMRTAKSRARVLTDGFAGAGQQKPSNASHKSA